MTVAPVFVDAEGIVRDWVNSLTGTLVGPGKPLELGAWLNHPRSPYRGAYLYLTAGRADDDFMTGAASRNPVYGQVYGVTRKQAADAAVAYANTLRQLYIANQSMPTVLAPRAVCAGVDFISGPLYSPDRDEERFLVDATFFLTPL